jgi:hypothetical protein
MTQLAESLERRVQPRLRQEHPCLLLVGERRHLGIVRDISAWGLFVQTPGELPPAADTIVALRTPEGKRLILKTSVPHCRQVSHSLASHTSGGVGLRIQNPPAAYLRWVESLSEDPS